MSNHNYGDDVEFIGLHTKLVELTGKDGARVAVSPEWQARVMTSTFGGETGPSFGWINRSFIASRRNDPKFNNYGGEDRFWIGPEAGQYGLWFRPGEAFTLRDFKTPTGFNSGPFELVRTTADAVSLKRRFELTNYSGSRFDCSVERTIRLLDRPTLTAGLAAAIPGDLQTVAFESVNVLANSGAEPWRLEGGLLCVWILGMFKPLPNGFVIAPFIPGSERVLGPQVKAYFGEVPAERLQLEEDHALFRCDGMCRTKIGIPRLRARPLVASWDPDAQVLTLVTFNLPTAPHRLPYVNSQWELQDEPFDGDVVNSYNDGRDPVTGTVLGPFYELESSSAAAALSPGESIVHVHRTCHVTGSRADLALLSRRVLGFDVTKCEFPALTQAAL